jgi:hypothetical protein
LLTTRCYSCCSLFFIFFQVAFNPIDKTLYVLSQESKKVLHSDLTGNILGRPLDVSRANQPEGILFVPSTGELWISSEPNELLQYLVPPDLPGDLVGMTFSPGTYKTATAAGLTGTLTLDAKGDPKPEWFFNIGGALTTTAASEMVGDGTDANVHWVVTGAISLGASSGAIGSMKASGAITVGAHATCGDLDAGGAITMGAHATCGDLDAGGAITVGAGGVYKSATTNAAVTLGAGAHAEGDTSGRQLRRRV